MITKSVSRQVELKFGDPELLFGLGLVGKYCKQPRPEGGKYPFPVDGGSGLLERRPKWEKTWKTIPKR